MEIIADQESRCVSTKPPGQSIGSMYRSLFHLGNIIELDFNIEISKILGELSEFDDRWKRHETYSLDNRIECLSFWPRGDSDLFISSLGPLLKHFSPQLTKLEFLRPEAGSLYLPDHEAQTDKIQIIIPLVGVCRNNLVFIYDEKRLILEKGNTYVLNRNVRHSIFSFAVNLILFCEVMLTQETLAKVRQSLSQK